MIFSLLLAHAAFAAVPNGDFLADLELFKARSLAVRSEAQAFEATKSATLSRLLQITPKLNAAVGREWDTFNSNLPGYSTDAHFNYWRAGLDWNLFRGGGDYLSWRSAKYAEDAQNFATRSQELKTELTGSQVIFRRLFLRDSAAAQTELLKLKQETLRIGRDRYSQGKIPLQDVAKMEVDLSQQQNVARQSEIDLAENEAAYRAFFVDELKTRDWPFLSAHAVFEAAGGQGSLEQLRLENRRLSLDEAWKASRAQHLPSVDLKVGYKNYPLSAPSNQSWSGTLELSVPIWSRWEIASENAAAYAASVRAEDEAAQNERVENLRWEFLRKKMQLSRGNLEEARANLDRADRLYRDMLRSFQLGRLSTNDLFLEQDRKIRAILLYSQSRLDFHDSLMEACSVRGLAAAACVR
ncbi:MAG: TolC family protein [Bdellovibrionota bacterium]